MKLILRDNNYFVIRFDRDDEVMQGMADFCTENNIRAGRFNIIGALSRLTYSYYNLPNEQYEEHRIEDDLEICTVNGNVSYRGNQVVIHAHGAFSNRLMHVVGGHIQSMMVSATAEVVLTAFKGNIQRTFDETTGLYLMQ